MSRLLNNPFCKYCSCPLNYDNFINNTIVCSNCGSTYSEKPQKNPRKRNLFLATLLVASLGAAFYFQDELKPGPRTASTVRKKISNKIEAKISDLGFLELQDYLRNCRGQFQLECRRLVFKRMHEMEPHNYIVKSNYAYTLTESRKHKEAIVLYRQMILDGEGDYLLMSHYAHSLKSIGETEEAVKWLKKSISLKPTLVSAVKELATALVELGKPLEAASLLESYMENYPSSRDYLKGNLAAIKSQNPQIAKLKGIRGNGINLMAVSGNHHFLPISLNKKKPSESFMIDTGATSVTMSKELFEKHYGPLGSQSGRRARIRLADGSYISGKVVVLKKLRVGPWEVKEVEAVICDKCKSLAGKSLLKEFETKTSQKGSIEYMNIRRI